MYNILYYNIQYTIQNNNILNTKYTCDNILYKCMNYFDDDGVDNSSKMMYVCMYIKYSLLVIIASKLVINSELLYNF